MIAKSDEYSKLDYPKLSCPLQMPGFSNYEKSDADEANEPVTRRYYIEEMTEDRIKKVDVSLHGIPPETPPKQ